MAAKKKTAKKKSPQASAAREQLEGSVIEVTAFTLQGRSFLAFLLQSPDGMQKICTVPANKVELAASALSVARAMLTRKTESS